MELLHQPRRGVAGLALSWAGGGILLGALAFALHVAPASAHRSRPLVVRSSRLASVSLCRSQPGPHSYHWPLAPFDQQHPTRSNFGDPRTITWSGSLGGDGPGSGGDFSFHNGIDIEAPAGSPVYPVASGIILRRQPNAVVVKTGGDRKFLYWHILPSVSLGEHVRVDRTVLGLVQGEFDHLHFGEVDGFRIHNPVDPGHLTPYQDRTAPVVSRLDFESLGDLHQLDPQALEGVIAIDAQAADPAPLPIVGIWDDRPVVPALLTWHLDTADGAIVVPDRTVADFRHTEPPNRLFWSVYADGTYQNFPVFGDHYFWGTSGRYLFNLTPQGFDTRTLPNGTYRLTVDTQDICGNRGSLTQELEIRN